MASARISPLTLEYQAFKGIASSLVGGISGFNAQIGDLYGKFRWDINSRNSLELFGLGTLDRYSLSLSEDSRQGMGWHNGIAQLRYAYEGERGRFTTSVSYNRYGSSQEEDKVYREVRNYLSLKSDMTEVTARVDRLRRAGRRERVELSYGAKYRYAQFEPGQVGAINNLAHVHLADAYFQFRYSIPEKLEIKANARGNFFQNSKDRLWYIDPSGSALARWNISKTVTVEAGYDYLVQYYHSLEGLPVGWSTDMLVPSGASVKPETTMQESLAVTLDFTRHKASIGGFYRDMDNLVFYKYSQTMFNGGFASWEEDVEQGQGRSFGGEFLYEYLGRSFYARASYTLSKTTRSGFPSYYDGGEFHARFDRTHVLNILAQWKGFSASFTVQSGHWEHGAAMTYPMHILDGEQWTASYYSGVYNYHMPTVLRLDIGYQHTFRTGRFTHDLNVGINNVTNHFNPFTLYFDAEQEKFEKIKCEIPMMFVQEAYLESFTDDVADENKGLSLEITVSSEDIGALDSYYETLLPAYDEIAALVSPEDVIIFIGEKNSYFDGTDEA